jgi:amidase
VTADPLGALVPGSEPAAPSENASGPLTGLTMVVKDVIDVAGAVTGGGNPDWAAAHDPAEEDAAAVATLTRAGAALAGKGQCAELAFSLSGDNVHFGMPRNSPAPDRDPGGSTSGPASAVAGGLCDLGLGTDTLGSTRVPASYCGLFGYRPTHGAIPTAGVMPLAQRFDTVGLLARDPSKLLRAARVLLDVSDKAEGRPPDRLLLSSTALGLASPEVAEAMREATGHLARRVDAAVSAEDPLAADMPTPDEALLAFNALQGAQVWSNYGRWIESASPSLGADIAARFKRAAGFGPEDVAAAEPVAAAVAAAISRLDRGEMLLLPAAGTIAPRRDANPDEREKARVAAGHLTCIASLAGAPSVSLPMLEIDGLPAGLSLVAAPGCDLDVLAAASAARAEPS